MVCLFWWVKKVLIEKREVYLIENIDLLIRETSVHLCVFITTISMVTEICKLSLKNLDLWKSE